MSSAGRDRVADVERHSVVEWVIDSICDITGLSAAEIRETSRIEELGLESLAIVSFSARLERSIPELRRSFIFDCRTIGEIVDYLLSRHPSEAASLVSNGGSTERFAPESDDRGAPHTILQRSSSIIVDALDGDDDWPDIELPPPAARLPVDFAARPRDASAPHADVRCSTDGVVAVVGMHGRFPGASNLDAFWANLLAGVDFVSEIPADRWRLDGFYEKGADSRKSGRSYAKWGSFLTDVDAFDTQFFGIPPREARLMDPQERVFLECAYHAMENAALVGERRNSLKHDNGGLDVGVFVGLTTNTYQLKGPAHWRSGGVDVPTSMPWSSANRVSYFLDLSGPSVAVDTACSSSLVALHLAVESVASGECAAAIAGGVNLYLHPAKYVHLCQYQMLSPTGRTSAFGAEADGFVPGEGVGAVVLRRLDDALRENDRILGVIRSSATNHSGRTNGYTVPGSRSQAQLIRKALAKASLQPDAIGAIEAHGTGTKLGDPIEFAGLVEALGGESGARCAVSSLKANIGHLEAAAGMASVLKVLLQLENDRLAPSIHSRALNPDLHLDGSRFFVPQQPVSWPIASDGRRRAGISSFGAGGAGAHVIVEEPPQQSRIAQATGPLVFPISAQSIEQLRLVARRLRDWIEASDESIDRRRLQRIAYTLQCGRAALRYRFAIVADRVDDLVARLADFVDEPTSRAVDSARGAAEAGAETAASRAGADPDALAARWAKGDALQWRGLWSHPLRPDDIPLYPFLRERHALPDLESKCADEEAGPKRTGEPLAVIELGGAEYFLREHRIGGRETLSGTALLGLCVKALDATSRESGGAELQGLDLRDIAWLSPYQWGADSPRALSVTATTDDDVIALEVFSAARSAPHCIARAKRGRRHAPPVADTLAAIKARCERPATARELYGILPGLGIEFGESFRCVSRAWRGAGEALVEALLPDSADGDDSGSPFHAGLLDGVFQSAFFALDLAPRGAMVPVRARSIRFYGALGSRLFVHVARVSAGDEQSFDYRVFSPESRLLCEIEALAFRQLSATTRPAGSDRTNARTNVFRPIWTDEPVERVLGRRPENILLLEGSEELARAIGSGHGGARLRRVVNGTSFEIRSDGDVHLDLERADHLDHLWRLYRAEGALPDAVVLALSDVDDVHAPADASWRRESGLAPIFRAIPSIRTLAQACVAARRVRLLFACRCERAAAAVAAMMRSVCLEFPNLACTVVHASADASTTDIGVAAARELQSEPSQNVRVARLAGKSVQSLGYAPAEEFSRDVPSTPDVTAGDVVLVVGGMGAIGARLAKALARPGVRVALLGRSHESLDVEKALDRLRAQDASCGYWRCDCADREALAETLDSVRESFGPITGVLHCAGVLHDALFARQSQALWDDVVKPKVAGAIHLDALTRDDPLRWFVVSSALAGVCGNVGQSLYGLANGWLDAFAAERRRLASSGAAPGRTVSIAWPLWDTPDGMQAPERFVARLRKEGLSLLEPADGVRLFEAATRTEHATLVPVAGEPERAAALFEAGVVAAAATAERSPDSSSALLPYLVELLASVTGTEPARIDADTPLRNFGLDSLLVVEMSEKLRERFPSVPVTALFEAQSLRALAQLLMSEASADVAVLDAAHFQEQVETGPGEPQNSQSATFAIPASFAPEATSTQAIAIVGLAGRYPQSKNLAQFWDHLRSGADLIVERPARTRSDDEAGDVYARWGSFIDDVECFDPLFFGISPRDAERMDPQERIFLQTSWHAVEDAGYTPETLSDKDGDSAPRRVAVIAGVMYGEYQFYGAAGGAALSNSSYASIANRVSYCLDFDGPSFAVDSMCSSSLTAIHLACDMLRGGGCDVALAGGVNLSLHSYKFRMLSELKFASSDGRCRSFGEGGDGYVPGEGCGVVVLKRLADAVEAGDYIYAVIRGGDIGHGARTSGYTVPNPDAQADVVRRAYERSGVDPSRLSYVEAHGTGTSLGDPIEIRGLTKAIGSKFAEGEVCAIGSLKSNIGHLEAAAGVAALTKVLLQLERRQIAPSIHSETLNPFIEFARTPFRVQRELAEWTTEKTPRLAAISAFGAGGSNAHLIIEEWVEDSPASSLAGHACLCFSAPSDAQLEHTARAFLEHIERELDSAFPLAGLGRRARSLHDVAATLRYGRRRFERRLAIVAADFADLRRKLAIFLDASPTSASDKSALAREAVFVGGSEPRLSETHDELTRQAIMWVTDRRAVAADRPPRRWRRTPLPGHVFQRRRFWLGNQPQSAEVSSDDIVSFGPAPARAEPASISPAKILAKVRTGDLTVDAARAMLLATR
ncbi:SDR family NAD(P)-dependent oxidoreductase [Methylosinus sp. Ce-a6]|uniref:SDR family NAD(P)-dependent oxidoreductase n=1 Tax=Methylosinus sp. Ce-a6 TaxID=2172005 RepID=UPI001359513B|nr:SDR family NAD(P)-dependent oxidoreductase [Methylosinus sp. Ce-a6]